MQTLSLNLGETDRRAVVGQNWQNGAKRALLWDQNGKVVARHFPPPIDAEIWPVALNSSIGERA